MSEPRNSTRPSNRFTDHDLAKLQRSDQEQKALRDVFDAKRSLSKHEHAALELDSVAAFNIFWNNTVRTQAEFEARRQRGAHRRMRQIQNFGETASDIMRQLDPLITAGKDFGYPFGGMAIGTIALFFTLAQSKAAIEGEITETLHQIKDRIAGFRAFERIYNDDHELDQQLQSQIVIAYDAFIAFCITSTRYYSRKGIGRWLRALVGPNQSVVDHGQRVQSAVVDVRRTTEELLNKSVDTIKQHNIALRKHIQQLQEDHDSDRLSHVQSLLLLETYSLKPDWSLLNDYQGMLDLIFADWIYVELMTSANLIAFAESRAMQAWEQSPQSQMLLLVGYNDKSYASSNQCWLSPVALYTILKFKEVDETTTYAFYIIGYRGPRSCRHVLSTIILQLLQQNRYSLRNQEQYAELCAQLQIYRKEAQLSGPDSDGQEWERKANKSLQTISLSILNMLPRSKTVCIVLDRVDRCGSSHKSPDGKRLLKALGQLVEKASIRVRVLAVANGYDWPADKDMDEFECKKERIVCLPKEQGPFL